VTTLGQRKTGDAVNLEIDVIARYVNRAFSFAKNTCGVDIAQ
jgi:riboflavin synthase alpha subunit